MGRLIKQGIKGADVRAVQDVLNFHIRRLAPLEVDGSFGLATHARVMEFQKSNSLKPDGIVGPITLGKLFEEELLPITVALAPQQTVAAGSPRLGIQPPRLIPPLTLPPLRPPVIT
ncbi:MAG: peptidoglycan-binding protein, partial [Haliea sp.]